MIHSERAIRLNDRPVNRAGRYVLYWMQQSQRTIDNHALEYAIDQAAAINLPLAVWFGLTPSFPEANARHYHFMIQGLKDVASGLSGRGIPFIVEIADPGEGAAAAGREAALVVTDAGYLRIQRQWRSRAAETLQCPLIQVESDVVVPVETVSSKEEYAAATIRKKIRRLLPSFVVPLHRRCYSGQVKGGGRDLPTSGRVIDVTSLDDGSILRLAGNIGIDTSIKPVDWISGGQDEAGRRFKRFLNEKLSAYDALRNDPSRDAQSDLSPFLHFGHLSPLTIVLGILAREAQSGRRPVSSAAPGEFRLEALSAGAQAFIEELVIRRELSANYCRFNPQYDSLKALPAWAYNTLKAHQSDKRPYIYSIEELEEGRTHDRYWNAACREMVERGKMHGYMRMYWGKKIIEWTKDIETAHAYMVYLDNKYFLDGRDMNGYAGIAWCFGKHDRPWKEREIFGKVRYMNSRGLERKFDIKAYAAKFGM